jgi:hypothetical protein
VAKSSGNWGHNGHEVTRQELRRLSAAPKLASADEDNEVSYPAPSRTHAPWLPTPSERNVTNAPEKFVRMKREKIVTHYTLDAEPLNRMSIRNVKNRRAFGHMLRLHLLARGSSPGGRQTSGGKTQGLWIQLEQPLTAVADASAPPEKVTFEPRERMEDSCSNLGVGGLGGSLASLAWKLKNRRAFSGLFGPTYSPALKLLSRWKQTAYEST